MNNRRYFILILVVAGLLQFLVLPVFTNMALGGKIAVFSFFVICLFIVFLFKSNVWILPKIQIPLLVLSLIFLISLLFSARPEIGLVDLGYFIILLLFCFLISNLFYYEPNIEQNIYTWLRAVGLIVAGLCLYQYIDWIFHGQRNELLIPYLLPPGSSRVNGVYGQSNLTALLLLLTIVSFIFDYITCRVDIYKIGMVFRSLGFFIVSLAFFLTKSRAASLAFLVVSFVFLLLIYRKKLKIFHLSRLVTPLIIVFMAFGVSLFPFTEEAAVYSRSEISIDARFFFWATALLMFSSSPLLGVGLDHFKIYISSYAIPAHEMLGFIKFESMGYSNWAHSEIFQITAEAGIFGIILILVFLVLLFRSFTSTLNQCHVHVEKVFLYLLMIPFFIQSLFSWPFRHPALLIIFFLLLGVVSSHSPHFMFKINNKFKASFLILLVFLSVVGGYIGYKEHQFLHVKKDAKSGGCTSDLTYYSMSDIYYGFNAMREILPICVMQESFIENNLLLKKYLPFYAEIASLQGTQGQWYNLGVVQRALGDYEQALLSFQKAVERQPAFELGWQALHAVNMERAVIHTGRPIEDFIYVRPVSVDYFESLLNQSE